MPSLVLFGHRTALSGDDLSVFTLVAILLRLAQVGLLFGLLPYVASIQYDDNDSNEEYYATADEDADGTERSNCDGYDDNSNETPQPQQFVQDDDTSSSSTSSVLDANGHVLIYLYWSLSFLLVSGSLFVEYYMYVTGRQRGFGTYFPPSRLARSLTHFFFLSPVL